MLYRGIIAVLRSIQNLITLCGQKEDLCNDILVSADAKTTSPRRADHLSRGVLFSVVCLSVMEELHKAGSRPRGSVWPEPAGTFGNRWDLKG